jgi:AcrR family transcriptional regulator
MTTAFRQTLRQTALSITGEIIACEGLAGVQARVIAEKAECSVGSLYNLFGDRDGLITAANRETLLQMEVPLRAAAEAMRGAALNDRLTALALAYMRFAFSNLNRWLAVFEFRLPPGRDLPDDYRAQRAELLSLLESAIAPDIADAPLRSRAARALFGAVHGIIVLAVNNKLSTFDANQAESEIRFIVDAAARGLIQSGAARP